MTPLALKALVLLTLFTASPAAGLLVFGLTHRRLTPTENFALSFVTLILTALTITAVGAYLGVF